mmetsp:Transcript_130011/g.337164  ORF Transcript_130011/g.337164 Transcript_130011/m.337164 type:complete len:250 (-) Transcript_130011:931-1680(-)
MRSLSSWHLGSASSSIEASMSPLRPSAAISLLPRLPPRLPLPSSLFGNDAVPIFARVAAFALGSFKPPTGMTCPPAAAIAPSLASIICERCMDFPFGISSSGSCSSSSSSPSRSPSSNFCCCWSFRIWRAIATFLLRACCFLYSSTSLSWLAINSSKRRHSSSSSSGSGPNWRSSLSVPKTCNLTCLITSVIACGGGSSLTFGSSTFKCSTAAFSNSQLILAKVACFSNSFWPSWMMDNEVKISAGFGS